MLISAIERTKKGRYSVFVDGEFLFAMHPDIYVTSGVSAGDDVDVRRLEELRQLSEEKLTRERALRLLSARAYTRAGLKRKLLAYAQEEGAEAAVARMEELGLLDDEDYARRYAADCLHLKGYAPSRAVRALVEKGIGRELAQQVLEELDPDKEAAIARLINRKYLRYLDDEKGVRKTINALVRLGYSFGDVRQVLANLAEDPDYYDKG